MIRYSLKCDNGHEFESWFASAAAFDALHASGHVTCAVCNSASVDKALMVPSVAKPLPQAPLSERSALEEQLEALRRHVEETSDYVGDSFADEARAIHLGEAPERPIWGEAKPDEARALIDDGVPVAPLPFGRKRAGN
ncbi:MAG: DUF1178 family protein [Paracoccaceae bacterium]